MQILRHDIRFRIALYKCNIAPVADLIVCVSVVLQAKKQRSPSASAIHKAVASSVASDADLPSVLVSCPAWLMHDSAVTSGARRRRMAACYVACLRATIKRALIGMCARSHICSHVVSTVNPTLIPLQDILNRLNLDLDGYRPGVMAVPPVPVAAMPTSDDPNPEYQPALLAAQPPEVQAAAAVSAALRSAGDLLGGGDPAALGAAGDGDDRGVEDILAALNRELDSLHVGVRSPGGSAKHEPPAAFAGGASAEIPRPVPVVSRSDDQLAMLLQKASTTRNAVLQQAAALQAKALAAAAAAAAAAPGDASSAAPTLPSLDTSSQPLFGSNSLLSLAGGVTGGAGAPGLGAGALSQSLASFDTSTGSEMTLGDLDRSLRNILAGTGAEEPADAGLQQPRWVAAAGAAGRSIRVGESRELLSRSLQQLLASIGVDSRASFDSDGGLSGGGLSASVQQLVDAATSAATSRTPLLSSLDTAILSGVGVRPAGEWLHPAAAGGGSMPAGGQAAAGHPLNRPSMDGLSRSIQDLLSSAYVEAEKALRGAEGLADAPAPAPPLSAAELQRLLASFEPSATSGSSQVRASIYPRHLS